MPSSDSFSLNHFTVVAKIVDTGILENLDTNSHVITVPIQLPQPKSRFRRFIYLTLWDSLAVSFNQYYSIYDYILIEGYISLDQIYYTDGTCSEDIVLTGRKIYPFNVRSSYSDY